MFFGDALAFTRDLYLDGADPRDPLASPLYADLKGLPALLIHVGADETLLDDSTRLTERARAAGVAVELTVWPAVPHVWQLFHRFVPEGRQSLTSASQFLNKAIEGAKSQPIRNVEVAAR
jgi:acetyl esterase/lipase